MARVVIILALLGAIVASMFAIAQPPKLGPSDAIAGPSATIPLSAKAADPDLATTDETSSIAAVAPRAVTNTETQSTPASAQDVADGPIAGAAPSIGTAGIDHKGKASFTGTASPGDVVSLVWDGKPIGTSTTDISGTWTIDVTAPKSKSEQRIYVSAQGKGGSVVIGPQRAVIRPPVTEGGLPRITLKAADQSATTLQEGNVAEAEVTTGLIVEKITNGEGGTIVLTGRADPAATVKAAINGKSAGEAKVSSEGAWTLTAMNPSGKSAKSVRLELFNKDGAAIDRSELPYKIEAPATRVAANETHTHVDMSSTFTSKPQPVPRKHRTKTETAALTEPHATTAAEEPKQRIIKVRRGDSLWRISKRHLGNGKRWARFYRLNKHKIDNPDMIYPGQTLILPG